MNEAMPAHVAIIMDGNGRWAQSKGLDRVEGHKEGAKVVREITTAAAEFGIKYLTLYAFSTENWSRPTYEVDTLMTLLADFLDSELPTMMNNNIRFYAIGDMGRIPARVLERLTSVTSTTSANTGMVLTLALSYGARDEIVAAVKKIARDISNNVYPLESLTDTIISSNLYTKLMPDPDLIIRTSGEQRLSNFMLWQAAYSEFYFTPIYWPDFHKNQFLVALENFGKRQRRYGAL